ncbi:MAG: hypothetical protein ACK55I_49430, partial [bacterium]
MRRTGRECSWDDLPPEGLAADVEVLHVRGVDLHAALLQEVGDGADLDELGIAQHRAVLQVVEERRVALPVGPALGGELHGHR